MTTRVIIDCDPGIDDAVAIMLALSSPKLKVEGLTIVHGNSVDTEKLGRNACTILHIAGKPEIPVHIGASVPIYKNKGTGAEFVHGENCLGDIELPHVQNQPHPHHSAVEFIVSKVKQHPKEIVIIALGPLTNIALALQIYPQLAENVKDLVIMGGAVFHTGNCSPVAEANIYHDPEAANLVFHAKWPKPFTLVPLDITHKVIMKYHEYKVLHDSGKKSGVFLYNILDFYNKFHEGLGLDHMYVHDATAVMAYIYPELFKERTVYVGVETTGEIARGMTICFERKFKRFPHDPNAHNVKVILDGDIKVIKEKLLQDILSLP